MIIPREIADTADVARHYDELDRFYRELWGEHVHHGLWITGRETPEVAVRQLIDRVAAEAQIKSGDRVCDVGCGYGGTSRYLVAHHEANVVGFTVSPAQHAFAVAHTNGHDNPQYLLCDWLENTLDAASQDAVVSIECLAHVGDKQAYFDQIHRVLRPGGRAAITAWLSAPDPSDWKVRHLLEPICREGRLPSMGTATEYQAMIHNAGLRLIQYEDLSRLVRKTWRICAGRVAHGLATNSDYRRAALDRNQSNRIFAVTLGRILAAYQTGAMQYGLFTFARGASSDGTKR